MESVSKYISERLLPPHINPKDSKDNAGKKTSDESLLYRIGYYNLCWKSAENQESIINRYNIRGDHYRDGVIQYAKDHSYPFLPDELEVVHRKDWELDILNGVSLDALYHKHYDMWFDNMYKNLKPRHKVLVVFQCSNKKPYCYTQVNRWYVERFSDFTDFASMEYGIVPWDFSNLYPMRWDEWDHYSDDEYMSYCYAEVTKKRILEFHKRFPEYKKIIFACQNNKIQRSANELWEDNTDNFRDWAVILTNDEFRKGIKRAFKPGTNDGIVIQRTWGKTYAKRKLAEEIAKSYKDKETKDLIMKRLNMDKNELESENIYNIYDPDIAKKAYDRGILPCDPKFMADYRKEHNKDE